MDVQSSSSRGAYGVPFDRLRKPMVTQRSADYRGFQRGRDRPPLCAGFRDATSADFGGILDVAVARFAIVDPEVT
jgi:hypothetical protein